jgi:hypothetical protein
MVFFSPLEQFQCKMSPVMPIIVILLFGAVCALGYNDYRNKHFSWVAFLVPLFLLAMMCSIIYTLSQSVELTLVRLAYGLCVVLVAPAVRSVLSSNPHFQQMVKDGETITNHWKQDKDLRRVKRFLILLRGLSVFTLFLGAYFLNTFFQSYTLEMLPAFKAMSLQEFFLMPGPFCIILAFVLWFLTNAVELYYTYDIIFYRNTPTMYKIANFCLHCTKNGGLTVAGAIGAGCGILEVTSTTYMLETTTLGNMWQIYGPTGRGFGFSDQVVHHKHVLLQNCTLYHPTKLMNGQYIITEEAQNAFIQTYPDEVYRHTTAGQRQLTGLKPPIWGFIKSYFPESK